MASRPVAKHQEQAAAAGCGTRIFRVEHNGKVTEALFDPLVRNRYLRAPSGRWARLRVGGPLLTGLLRRSRPSRNTPAGRG